MLDAHAFAVAAERTAHVREHVGFGSIVRNRARELVVGEAHAELLHTLERVHLQKLAAARADDGRRDRANQELVLAQAVADVVVIKNDVRIEDLTGHGVRTARTHCKGALADDPAEMHDLSVTHPKKLAELIALWNDYVERVNVILPNQTSGY